MELSPQQLGQSLYRLGRQLLLRRHFEEAKESFALSLQFMPGSAETCFELGNLMHACGRHSEAADHYVKAIESNPHFAQAWYNLGVVRMIMRDLGKSRLCFEYAISLDPGYAEAHNNLAILMQAAGQIDNALDHYREAAKLQPQFIEPQYNLGLVLQERQEFEECVAAYEVLLARKGDHVDARNNLANVLLELGRPSEARRAYERVLQLDPNHPEANWNLGLVQLQLGDWGNGWRNYEWRFRQPARKEEDPLMPRWDGHALKGRRILLTAEQGLGDMLQFLRYVPEVVSRGGRVLVECHAPLTGLVGRIPGVEATVVKGEERPHHDCWAPLLSIPAILELLEPAAHRLPYLEPEPQRVELWREFLDSARKKGGSGGRKMRIGVTWSGNPQFKANAKRTLEDRHVRALTQGHEKQATFYSLQKGLPIIPDANLVDPHDDASSLEDVAAIVANLDLVISVDTSVAHLAGALSTPVWTLLAHAADWRWMASRRDSPWYPSMRLFRQPKRGDWNTVVEDVRHQLGLLLN